MQRSNDINNKLKFFTSKILPIAFWLILWYLADYYINNDIILSSPIEVAHKLLEMSKEKEFWASIYFSLGKIVLGFFIGVAFGCILSAFSIKLRWLKDLLNPLVIVMRSIPVASFIILCLMWIDVKNLSVFISFMMVFPIMYQNMYTGLENVNKDLLEMAKVFNLSAMYKVKYIYLSNLLPFFKSASIISLSLSFKSGIAAEVIGKPLGSIGEKLYGAKLYLNTAELLAWTVVIIIFSMLFEKLFLILLDYFMKYIEES
ncbi:MAG: ABC transporter permease [Lachnospirales bacterium]